MSRSALARSDAFRNSNVIAAPEFDCNEVRQPKANELEIHGNQHNYNLNTLLFQNITQSNYFKSLYSLKTYHEVVDEIYYRADHAEPLAKGTSRTPSSCFCLLLKFCTMRLTLKQMQGLLNHVDSPFIRCVGFLYLRYTMRPESLWSWFEPFLDDSEEFNASTDAKRLITIGSWLRGLLEDQQYYGTLLPRLPKKILDDIKVKFLLRDQKSKRASINRSSGIRFFKGDRVRALYSDADNPPAMYDAVIDEEVEHEKYWVTFTEYGNSELISIGDIDPIDRRNGSKGSSNAARAGRYGSSIPKTDMSKRFALTDDLLQQVRNQSKEQAQAVGRDYAQRPATYKGSLSLKADRYTNRKRSRSPKRRERTRSRSRSYRRSRSPRDRRCRR